VGIQQGIRRTAVALALAMGVAGAAHAQTADELVAKNLKAKGGLDNLKAVQGMKITGRVMLPMAGGGSGMEIPMSIVTKRPNRFRQESEFNGQKIVVGFDGTKAWMINPMMGPSAQPIEGDRLEIVKQQADLDGPLVDYKAKGTTIEVQGVETVDGKQVNKLKVTPKAGRPVTLYLDAATGLEYKTVMETPAEAAGPGAPAAMLESIFSNYQTVGKLTMPHTIQQKANGQVLQINIDKIELSPASVDDSVFAMPSGASVAPKQ
jgi:outer membrane lipoprotein-sorting protein